MHLAGLFIYPVKSLAGGPVPAALLEREGLAGDRRFLVTDPAGRFLTQREEPRLGRLRALLDEDRLHLEAPDGGTCAVPRADPRPGTPRPVTVWRDEGLPAEDCGDRVAAWLEAFLGRPVRLMRAGPAFRRIIRRPPGALAGAAPPVSFADAYPLLAISEASLTALNDRLAEHGQEPVTMARFRPNLVFAGGPPHAEDAAPAFRIGAARLHAAGPCARCGVVTLDPLTGTRGVEPLAALAAYRRDPARPGDVIFGQNLVPAEPGAILRPGEPVVPI